MNYKYYWLCCRYRSKKILFNTIEKLVWFYLFLITQFLNLLPQKYLFYFFWPLQPTLYLGLSYFYLRSQFLDDINILHKMLPIAELVVRVTQQKNFNARMLDAKLLNAVTAIMLLAGRKQAVELLLQQKNMIDPARIIEQAQRHFDLGDFAACEKFLVGARVLQVEDPHSSKGNKDYKIIPVDTEKSFDFVLPKVFAEPVELVTKKTVMIPPLQIYQLQKAEIFYGHTVVKDNMLFLYESAARPCFADVFGYHHRVYGSHFQTQSTMLYGQQRKTQKIESAVLLSGRCAANYFHWLIEYLPRYYTLSKIAELQQLPLLVDEAISASGKQALKIIAPEASIIWINQDTKLEVDNLYIPSFHTFHPDTRELPYWKGAGISFPHLAFIRDKAYQQATITKPSRRLFIHRSVKHRSLENSAEITRLLESYGFETVDPGAMNFIAQVELFASAQYIIGAAGAAFTNLIFCQPECKIISLISPQVKDFCIQSNLAAFAGCEFMHVSGISDVMVKALLKKVWRSHSSFAVSPAKLEQAVQQFFGITR
jgi:hypothetical protein